MRQLLAFAEFVRRVPGRHPSRFAYLAEVSKQKIATWHQRWLKMPRYLRKHTNVTVRI